MTPQSPSPDRNAPLAEPVAMAAVERLEALATHYERAAAWTPDQPPIVGFLYKPSDMAADLRALLSKPEGEAGINLQPSKACLDEIRRLDEVNAANANAARNLLVGSPEAGVGEDDEENRERAGEHGDGESFVERMARLEALAQTNRRLVEALNKVWTLKHIYDAQLTEHDAELDHEDAAVVAGLCADIRASLKEADHG